ncbi:hypothetical protein MG296_06620 [Flavobacteriaceae bacterium TK19130]|nr:hypothetical protein [Thermobacterium salinum]
MSTNDSLVYQRNDLSHYLEVESNSNSTDITSCYSTSISESLLPNVSDFDLESSKAFHEIDESGFSKSTEYFFSANDSIVRAIIHEWDWPLYSISIKDKIFETNEKSDMLFAKFLSIKDNLVVDLGTPIKKVFDKGYYRESFLWNNTDKSKAYLFILGNEQRDFYRLRLITYE